MAPTTKSKKKKQVADSDSTGSSVLGLLAVAAAAAAGFWWWRRRQQGGGSGSGKAGGRSSFKFPAGTVPQQLGGNGKPVSNKKNKARKKEEKARRAEKREKAAAGPQQQGKGGGGGGEEQAGSTSVINYTYFDSARKDSLLPAAKKRPDFSAADAVQMQQDAASSNGSGASGSKKRHAMLILRALASARLLCWVSALAGEPSRGPASSPGQECSQCGTLPPSQPTALRAALPWALAAVLGAAGCLWLLWRQRPRRQQRRLRHLTLQLTTVPEEAAAAASGQSASGSSTPSSSVVLQRSADGTILSPFQRESSLPPFSGSSSAAATPRGMSSAAGVTADPAVARRLADLLVHPAAGTSPHSPRPPLPGQNGVHPNQSAAAAGTDALLVDTPVGSAEQQLCTATVQGQNSGSLPVPYSSGCIAAPPPELAWHVAAMRMDDPQSPPASGGGQQQQQQHVLTASELPPRLRELYVEPSHIEIVRGPKGRLGEGASGYVVKARFQHDQVAAKVFDMSKSQELRESFLTECSRLAHLRHPNIITLLGLSLTRSNKGIMLLEFAEGHDLFSALQLSGHGSKLGRVFGWWRQGARVALEIARAINHCHHKGYVHGDIKSSNVLLCGSGTAKLADVAFSRRIEPPPPELESFDSFTFEPPPLAGTFAWMAPEVLLGSPASPAADVYSFGVLLHEIITGEQPMRGSLRMPRVPEECPQEACDLMMRCLSVDPEERPTSGQLLQDLGCLKRRSSLDAAMVAAEWGAAAAAAPDGPGPMRRRASFAGA